MIDGTKMPYSDTEVSIDKSKQKINDLLREHDTKGIQWTWIENREVLRFIHEYEYKGQIKTLSYEIEIPEMGRYRGRGYDKRLERNDRQAYRIVWHVLKNKFVAVDCQLKTFENEFLSEILYKLPDGSMSKVSDIILSQIDKAKSIDLLEKKYQEE